MSDLFGPCEGVLKEAKALGMFILHLFLISLVMFSILLWARWHDYGWSAEKPLHKCLDTPRAHQLWVRHADNSRYLVGTMPLYIGTIRLATGDRLITGECE